MHGKKLKRIHGLKVLECVLMLDIFTTGMLSPMLIANWTATQHCTQNWWTCSLDGSSTPQSLNKQMHGLVCTTQHAERYCLLSLTSFLMRWSSFNISRQSRSGGNWWRGGSGGAWSGGNWWRGGSGGAWCHCHPCSVVQVTHGCLCMVMLNPHLLLSHVGVASLSCVTAAPYSAPPIPTRMTGINQNPVEWDWNRNRTGIQCQICVYRLTFLACQWHCSF